MEITKSEWKYILISAGFLFVWFRWVVNLSFSEGNIFTNFLIFNLGIFIFFQIFLRGFITKDFFSFKEALGFTILFFSADLNAPPFAISKTGELLSGLTLTSASSDYVMGFLGQSWGITGALLYYFVYILVPIIGLVISAILIKDFVKNM